jgi:hypothetical protein
VFGINNINTFKQSLTREFQLRRMEVGQKMLRGLPVSEEDMRAVGSHLTAPPPAAVIAKAAPPPRRRRRVRKPRAEEDDMVAVVVDADAGSRSAAEASAARRKKRSKCQSRGWLRTRVVGDGGWGVGGGGWGGGGRREHRR